MQNTEFAQNPGANVKQISGSGNYIMPELKHSDWLS